MLKQTDPEIQTKWQRLVEEAELPEWIQEMHRHYWKTGRYRPEDLRRLLGDPNQGVEIGPHTTLSAAMAQSQQGQ